MFIGFGYLHTVKKYQLKYSTENTVSHSLEKNRLNMGRSHKNKISLEMKMCLCSRINNSMLCLS